MAVMHFGYNNDINSILNLFARNAIFAFVVLRMEARRASTDRWEDDRPDCQMKSTWIYRSNPRILVMLRKEIFPVK